MQILETLIVILLSNKDFLVFRKISTFQLNKHIVLVFFPAGKIYVLNQKSVLIKTVGNYEEIFTNEMFKY